MQPRGPDKGTYSEPAPSDASELEGRAEAPGRALIDQGITFSLSGRERPFPLDLVPRHLRGRVNPPRTRPWAFRRAMRRAIGVPGARPSSARRSTGKATPWVQAWTGGWSSYDPANDAAINEQYVSVGRDYSEVSPLKGIYSGADSTDPDVVVEITRLA